MNLNIDLLEDSSEEDVTNA